MSYLTAKIADAQTYSMYNTNLVHVCYSAFQVHLLPMGTTYSHYNLDRLNTKLLQIKMECDVKAGYIILVYYQVCMYKLLSYVRTQLHLKFRVILSIWNVSIQAVVEI